MMTIAEVKRQMTGPIPSVRTPFLKNGDIDWKGLDNQIDFLIEESKAPTLLVTNGDSLLTLMSEAEVAELNKRVVETANHRAMVIASGKFWNYKMGVEFIKYSKERGADIGIAPIADWGQSAGNDECFDSVCETGKIMPVIVLTNLVNGRGLPLSVFEKLAKEKPTGFVGIKDDVCGDYGRRLAGLFNGNFAFMSGGLAVNHLDSAPYKTDGYLSLFASFYPKYCHEYWDLYTKNDILGCGRWIIEKENPYVDMLDANGLNFDAACHGMMELAGICGRYRRSPYSSMTDAQMEILSDYAKKAGMF